MLFLCVFMYFFVRKNCTGDDKVVHLAKVEKPLTVATDRPSPVFAHDSFSVLV